MVFVQFNNGTHIQDEPDPSPNHPIELYIYSVISFLSFFSCSGVVGSVIFSKKTRVEGFNLYLVFLLVPDIFLNVWVVIEIINSFIINEYPTRHQCIIGNMSIFTYLASNTWMNVLVGYEVFQMLQHSHQARRFKPSSPGVVIRRTLIVYLLSIIAGLLLTFNSDPLLNTSMDSKTCFPKCENELCEIIQSLILFLTSLIPVVYLIYITCVVYRKKLLPPAGKSRFLTQYFLRISFISVLSLISIIVSVVFSTNYSVYFCSLLGIIVAVLSLGKRDVKAAVKDIFCCCSGSNEDNGKNTKNTANSSDVG